MRISSTRLLLTGCITLCSCSSVEEPFPDPTRRLNQVSEYIDRRADEFHFQPAAPKQLSSPTYSWEESTTSLLPRITKDFFRCQGSELNPMRTVPKSDGTPAYYHDCGGNDRHGLPLRGGQEFVYPILIELLNYLQLKTEKRVVITSGHRCPAHNTYVDESAANSTSKHMLGAAVTFYVQGLEEQTGVVVQHLLDYYGDTPRYQGKKEFQVFQRDHSAKQPSTIPAWLNKEIAIRVYPKSEGRNFDNRHPYPYVSITVRYDRELGENVSYSWEQAQKNYLRG